MVTENILSEMGAAVADGLSQNPKRLPGWLFYDEKGDELFQSIMKMPGYYLTRCEYEILDVYKDNLLQLFKDRVKSFNLIELGAGDATKTEILLKHFSRHRADFIYTPIDISGSVLQTLETRLKQSIPDLVITPINNSYEHALAEITGNGLRKIFLFLGANIGNFKGERAAKDFLNDLVAVMSTDDLLLIGFDLKKDPRLIQAAYDDPDGITREFNLNILHRLNRELGANFNIDWFSHYPCYDAQTGILKSYLISKTSQVVHFENMGWQVHFNQWEVIHTEVSLKYDEAMIKTLAGEAGLETVLWFSDANHYFCDVLLKKK